MASKAERTALKAERRRKKATEAAKDGPSTTTTPSATWTRLQSGGRWAAADDREVDDNHIVTLLKQRATCKAAKDFASADALALELRALDVCYLDNSSEWYARKLGSGGVEKTKTSKNMRQAERKREPGHKRKRRRRHKEFVHEHAPLK
jgi:cysteinyl-tRNA synthetase